MLSKRNERARQRQAKSPRSGRARRGTVAAVDRDIHHETLSVVRLGLTGALRQTLRSIDAIESINGWVECRMLRSIHVGSAIHHLRNRGANLLAGFIHETAHRSNAAIRHRRRYMPKQGAQCMRVGSTGATLMGGTIVDGCRSASLGLRLHRRPERVTPSARMYLNTSSGLEFLPPSCAFGPELPTLAPRRNALPRPAPRNSPVQSFSASTVLRPLIHRSPSSKARPEGAR